MTSGIEENLLPGFPSPMEGFEDASSILSDSVAQQLRAVKMKDEKYNAGEKLCATALAEVAKKWCLPED